MIRVIMIGGILFVASAAASWFFLPESIIGTAGEAESAGPSSPDADTVALPPPEGMLPVAVRPQPMTPEEVLRHAASLRVREASLDERERLVVQRESQLELVEIDIRGEQQELESLREALEDDTSALEELLQQTIEERRLLEQERTTASRELQTIQENRAALDSEEEENLKDLAKILTPETAAGLIRAFVNDGQRDVAAKLLSNFEERDASQILESIGDPALIQELAEMFTQLKRPEPRARRR